MDNYSLTKNHILLIVALAFISMTLSACDFNQGPAEQAGEEIDEALNDANNDVEEVIDDAGEAIEKAGDNIREHTEQ